MARPPPPTDQAEAARVEWHPLTDIPKLAAGHIPDGPSLTALSYYFTLHRTGH